MNDNDFTIKGDVVFIGQHENFGHISQFQKRILVIKTDDGKKVSESPFTFYGDDMDCIEGIGIGDTININFSIRGFSSIKVGVKRFYPEMVGKNLTKL